MELEAPASGLVQDPQGEPVAGALVSWTPASLAVPGQVSSALFYVEWAAASELTETDAAGRFELAHRVLGEAGALWVTKIGFKPAGHLVAAQAEAAAWQLGLSPAEPLALGVVDPAGAAIPGAQVVVKASRGPSFGDIREAAFYTSLQLFMRRVEMDADGRGASAAPGLWLVQAADGALVSPQVSGFGAGDVELVLGAGLTVRGAVRGEVSAAFVAVLEEHADLSDASLAVIPVLPDGTIPTTQIPRAKSGVYRIQLEGAGIAPEVQRFELDEVGAELVLAFEAERARLLDFRFTDALTHEAVPGVDAYSGWPRADGLYLEVTQGSARSGEDGLVEVPFPLEGFAYVVHSKAGYLRGFGGPFDAEAGLEQPIEIALRPLGSVQGRVLLDGKPAHDFYVIQYEGDGYGTWQEQWYQDREDGSFLLEGLPAGPLHLLATSPGLAQSEPLAVEVVAGEVAEVELELSHGGVGRGRVLDARTLQPIEGAEVTRSLSNGERNIGAEPGVMVPVQADGSYELSGLSGNREQIGAFAAGYGFGETSAVRGAGGDFDMGTILLYHEQTLTLKVLLPEGVDPTAVFYYVSRSFFQGPGLLGPDGSVAIGGAKPGMVAIDLTLPTGEELRFDRMVYGEGPWVETLDLAGAASLRVFVSGIDPTELEATTLVVSALDDQVQGRCAQDRSQPAVGADKDGVLFAGFAAGAYSVALRDAAGVPLGAAVLELEATGAVTEFELAIEATPCAARVLDSTGAPLAGVLVWVQGPGFAGFVGASTTDEDGVAQLGNLPPGPALLCVNSKAGSTQEYPLDSVGTPDAPTELVYDPQDELLLTVTDRGVPLEGVMLFAVSQVAKVTLPWMSVGPGGTWHQLNVGSGSYTLRPVTPSIWYEEKTVTTGSSSKPVPVEFRRLGDLEVIVLDAYGQPIPGTAVELRSLEFGRSVTDWLATGRVKSATGLVTNTEGRIQIEGLPNGTYEAKVGAAAKQGEVPALGGGTIILEVVN